MFVSTTDKPLRQVVEQLHKLVNVLKADEYVTEKPHVELELMLMKLNADQTSGAEDVYPAELHDAFSVNQVPEFDWAIFYDKC
ncbi:hypothetical protein Tsubulata_045760 [Turnera subulata]|uniref:Uncharacterized protein n=1 Tax=Turnera subulata TaxID=218843 RepID=A0A9Q0FQL1_9ROSI|nr:hypothetical protein Tsubulata_045760 [Turnera subulata]